MVFRNKIILVLTLMVFALSISSGLAATYLANTNSGKFHFSDCSTIKHPNASHFLSYNSREAAIADGYIPCKRCNP